MNALFLVICSLLLLAPPAWAGEDGFALYRKGDYAKAAEVFGKKAMEEPDMPRWRYNRGVASARAGDKETAQGALASSMTRDADAEVRFKSAYNLGTLALDEKKYPEAVENFRKALSEKPGDQDAAYNLGLALWRQKKQEQEQQKKQQCKNPQQGQEGEQKDQDGKGGKGQDQKNQDQEKQDQKDDQNQQGQGRQDKKQQGKDQQQGQNQEQGQEGQKQADRTAGAPKPEEQDSEGKLETVPGTQAETGQEPRDKKQGQGMEAIRASALLDNVKENPAQLLFRGEGQENQRPTSGKDW